MMAPGLSSMACSTVSGATVVTTSASARTSPSITWPDVAVLVVGHKGVTAGSGLHGNIETGADQPLYGIRHQGDPAFAGPQLYGNGDLHVGEGTGYDALNRTRGGILTTLRWAAKSVVTRMSREETTRPAGVAAQAHLRLDPAAPPPSSPLARNIGDPGTVDGGEKG